MLVEVIVVPQGELPNTLWRYGRSSSNEFVVVDLLTNERHSPIDAWTRLSSKINSLSVNHQHCAIDVFLKWLSPSLSDLLELQAFTTLIDHGRNNSWGGQVYLAWNQSELKFYDCCSGEVLENWFLTIANSGLAGLIELHDDDKQNSQDAHLALAIAVLSARTRRRRLMEFVNEDGWIGIFRGGEAIEALINGLMERKLLPEDSKNEVIVCDRELIRNDLVNLERRSRYARRKGAAFAVDLTGGNLSLSGMPVVQFNGVFEWIYSFIQLNQARKLHSQIKKPKPQCPGIVWVDNSREMVVTGKVKNKDRRLLVTSALGPEPQNDCAAAAEEVGACLRQLPFDIEVEVHPNITCEILPDLIGAKEFTAWLHISHGKRGFGLKEALSRTYASADRWQRCFDACRGRLELAMLSACESAQIAEELAKRGIGVAIGFENDVYVKAARIVSERVIPSAFEIVDCRRAILNAFAAAYQDLQSRSYPENGETRYYIDCSPKAFASRK